MLVNAANLSTLFSGFSTSFNKGMEGAPTAYREIAMVVPSATSETTYGWLGQFPKLREWLGSRVVMNLAAHAYTVKNRRFESAVSISRTDIEDDQFGIFAPVVTEMGRSAGEHPDELVFDLLAAGFATQSYDGKFYPTPTTR